MSKRLVVAASLAFALLASLPAQAQVAVFDPANYGQNLLTAVRTLEQVNQQVRQLQNEAQMLTNQARHLQRLDFDALDRLRDTLAQTEQLLAQAKGVAFEVSQAQRQFARLYPDHYGSAATRRQLDADARERWSNSLEALRTAVELQAQLAETFGDDEAVLADLVRQSQSAAGALQAAQATNQLLALQAKQSIQTQQLQVVHDRATVMEQARTVAAQERSRELRRRFMRDQTHE